MDNSRLLDDAPIETPVGSIATIDQLPLAASRIWKIAALLLLDRDLHLHEIVLALVLQMGSTLVEAGDRVLVEYEKSIDPACLTSLRGNLRLQVVHQFDGLFNRLIHLSPEVNNGHLLD